MKLTNEEIKKLIFEDDTDSDIDNKNQESSDDDAKKNTEETEKTADQPAESDAEGEIEDDEEETSDNTEADKSENSAEDKSENSAEDKSENSLSIEEITSEFVNDGWESRAKDGINFLLNRTDDSNVFYILHFSNLAKESKFLTKIRELILEEDTTNQIKFILELVNTDTGIAYGPFELSSEKNYSAIKKAIADKATDIVDTNWPDEFADKELQKTSGLTQLLAKHYSNNKNPDESENQVTKDTDADKQTEQSDTVPDEKYIVDQINSAFEKLTEAEQDAFETIYGDKLIAKIQQK